MANSTIIVVHDPRHWPLELEGLQVVSARDYLLDPAWARRPRLHVVNLCRSYRYQRAGYYVSLLAAARGHRPMPTIEAMQSLKSTAIIRVVSEELDALIQHSLAPIQSSTFVLSVYFGRNLAARHNRLALALHRQFEAPLLRATFVARGRPRRWDLASISAIALADVPDAHRPFLLETVREHFARPPRRIRVPRPVARYDLAILHDPEETTPPSDERALRRFLRAARDEGVDASLITGEDYGRLAEFDALFIRETTAVNHRTFRFAQRAEAEGLVVIDDPNSILRCTNKVFLAEALANQGIDAPRTFTLHRDSVADVVARLPLPCVLKQPDSAFSQGVIKADTPEVLEHEIARLLERSDLIVAQEFIPTEFDWRIGVLDRRPLYACRYYMARRHWQIIQHGPGGVTRSGRSETLAVEDAPGRIVDVALRAANLIGDGLYGVDLKEHDGRVDVIEVNDNPSIEAGIEDVVLGDELYRRIVRVLVERIERRARGGWSR